MKKNRNPSREKAQAAHMERLNEIRSYGIDVKDKGLYGGAEYGVREYSSISDRQLQDARNKALKTNQREQLRSQNQEIAQLTLQRRRRSSGRQSLMQGQSPSTLGPMGSLG
jgi:hypothetical protein